MDCMVVLTDTCKLNPYEVWVSIVSSVVEAMGHYLNTMQLSFIAAFVYWAGERTFNPPPPVKLSASP